MSRDLKHPCHDCAESDGNVLCEPGFCWCGCHEVPFECGNAACRDPPVHAACEFRHASWEPCPGGYPSTHADAPRHEVQSQSPPETDGDDGPLCACGCAIEFDHDPETGSCMLGCGPWACKSGVQT